MSHLAVSSFDLTSVCGHTLGIPGTKKSSRRGAQLGTSAMQADRQSSAVILDPEAHRNPPLDLGAGSTSRTAVSDPTSDEGSDTDEKLEGSGESSSIRGVSYGSE